MADLFTPEEKLDIRRSMKNSLADLHVERQKIAEGGDMLLLMEVEDAIGNMESTWTKLKGML